MQFDLKRRDVDGLELERLVSEPKAAELLGISPDTLKRLATAGKIRRIAISPRRVAYKIKDVLALSNAPAA